MMPSEPEFKRHLLDVVKGISQQLRDVRYQKNVADISHSCLVSHATYSPWLDDAEFQRIFSIVRSHSLVDQYRMYQLWSLVGQLCCNPNLKGDVLEVGTWRGGTGCLIGARCAKLSSAMHVYLADTFMGVAKAGPMDTKYRGGEHKDASLENVESLGHELQLSNLSILSGLFPEETASAIADRSFRFGHIDVDAYQSGRDVFDWLWPRLELGGVIVFDDFGFWGCEGVTRLVQEICPSYDRVLITNLTGQAMIVKTG